MLVNKLGAQYSIHQIQPVWSTLAKTPWYQSSVICSTFVSWDVTSIIFLMSEMETMYWKAPLIWSHSKITVLDDTRSTRGCPGDSGTVIKNCGSDEPTRKSQTLAMHQGLGRIEPVGTWNHRMLIEPDALTLQTMTTSCWVSCEGTSTQVATTSDKWVKGMTIPYLFPSMSIHFLLFVASRFRKQWAPRNKSRHLANCWSCISCR